MVNPTRTNTSSHVLVRDLDYLIILWVMGLEKIQKILYLNFKVFKQSLLKF